MTLAHEQAAPWPLTPSDVTDGVDFVKGASRQFAGHAQRSRDVARDQVDDAANRVRPVQRGGGAFHDLDTLQSCSGLAIEIEHAALDAARPDERLAVEQHEDLPRVETLDLFAGCTSPFGIASGEHARQLAQHLADGLRSGVLHPIAADHIHAGVEGLPQLLLTVGGDHRDSFDNRRRDEREVQR